MTFIKFFLKWNIPYNILLFSVLEVVSFIVVSGWFCKRCCCYSLSGSLFCKRLTFSSRPEWWEEVKKAVDWVRWADRQYPCVYSRLEFGSSWESSTRQLLGYEGLPPFSPLSGLNLQRNATPVLVHWACQHDWANMKSWWCEGYS